MCYGEMEQEGNLPEEDSGRRSMQHTVRNNMYFLRILERGMDTIVSSGKFKGFVLAMA